MQIRLLNKFFKTKVEGSAIYYALLFLFLVGSLLFSFIYIFNAYNAIITTEKNDCQVLVMTHKVRHYIKNNKLDFGDYQIVENDFSGNISINNYGIFKHYIYSSSGSSFNFSIGGLLKPIEKEIQESLILGNSSFPLSVSGGTKIEGKIRVPERGLKKTFVSSGKRDGSPEINASIQKSDKDIPAIELEQFNFKNQFERLKLTGENIDNSFCQKTKILNVQNSRLNTFNSIKGNVVIVSEDSIFIPASLELENVIVKAPVIYIQEGAVITAQLIANEKIVLEDNVRMNYPSALILQYENIDTEFEPLIQLGEKCNYNGVIVLDSKVDKKSILVGEQSKIKGVVYSNRYLEFKDDVEITGQVISAKLYRKTASSEYDNLLLNINLKPEKEGFYNGFLSFRKENENQKWEVLLEDKSLEEKSMDTPYWKL